ncbi:hypothetical protein SAMN02745202_01479 [Segatella oulorum]|uniref:Fimbrillin-like n=2 Tax=Segatella oulorum TaxID=28136 RepID=A0A1T4PLC5_9BACT|nr:hypothetical protein SAMN02745202_01479 [Segatella oulorum]
MGCLAGLLLLSACSSEENMADTGNKIDVSKGIRFQFTEEAFVPGEVAAAKQGTRALAEPQEIDLGNGIIAEATLEPDTAGCAQTRAGNPVPDGTYKIYAIDAGGTRHDGLTGTMTGGVFTPNNKWELESGTYTFVCINSAVTDNGNELYVQLNHEDGMSLIGVSDPVTVTNPFDVFVSFVMRHQQARVRFQFVSYTEPIESPSLTGLYGNTEYNVGSAYFDLKGNRLMKYGNYPGWIHYPSNVIHLNQPYQPSSITKEYTYTTDYILCSPEYTYGSYYTINGTLYGRTFQSNKLASLGTLQKNHSYIWKLKLKNKDPWYLYNDGTIGSLAKRGSRTPIAVVLDEKTTTTDGLAVALKSTSSSCMWNDDATTIVNPHAFTNFDAAIADMDGYRWTYESDGSADHIAKADVAVKDGKYNAFYQAIHYNAGVPLTFSGGKTGKWFLPSLGQVHHLVLKIGKGNMSAENNPSKLGSGLYKIDPLETSFINAGGTFGNNFWTSTEYSKDAAITCASKDDVRPYREVLYFNARKNKNEAWVRPFIYY